MSADPQQMKEIKRDEAWLGGCSSPLPSEATVLRAKEAARLTVNEGWLAGSETPGPSKALVANSY